MKAYCYITFPTTYFAVRAEALLKKSARRFNMVPVPRSISSSCGTALRCSCETLAEIRALLALENVEVEGCYRLEEKGLRRPVVTILEGTEKP